MIDGKNYVLSLSYGKDSMACLGAIEKLGLPLDDIVHAEVWATDTVPADLPPMVEFKNKADKIIKERFGIDVRHVCAMRDGEKITYEKLFYGLRKTGNNAGKIYGFPAQKAAWCVSRLKTDVLENKNNSVKYIGIAADENERIERNRKPGFIMPLVEVGWSESDCLNWCKENDLLSPIYENSFRSGCWFCHNQGVGQLRSLREKYPQLWRLMIKWGGDSPVPFKIDRQYSIANLDKRFELEEKGLVPKDKTFRWKMIKEQEKV